MKIKIKLLSFIIFFLFFLHLSFTIESPTKIKNEIDENVIVHVTSNDQTINVELEEYLIGVVAAEMPATFEEEALKAQAVVSRSFVYSRNLKVDDTVKSQVYHNDEKLKEKWKENYDEYITKIKKAVNMTKGQVIVFDEQIISALFFSSSNGKTNNSEDYWTTSHPYLVSVDSIYEEIKENKVKYTKEEINKIFGFNVTSIEIKTYYENGYVEEVLVNKKIYSGKEIRELCGLKSSSFQINLIDDSYEFLTKGNGHGVGMSQYGAQGMALAGYNYEEIIKHYYQGVEIVNK